MKIALLGYGKTTKAISKYTKCDIFDDNIKTSKHDDYGNMIYPSCEFTNIKSDVQIPSPGISPSHNLIKQSSNIISEYDFFDDTSPLKIWISGTNGKTTMTKMAECLLRDKGAIYGGNIGTPLASMDTNKKIWLLETSSFTLHYTKKAKPNIYVLLPITSDHISWHGSFEEYEKAKLYPLEVMSEGDIAIVPNKYKNTLSDAHLIGYDTSDDIAKYFKIDKTLINFKEPFLLDALLAMAIEKILYFQLSYDKINSFLLDAHKIEEIFDSTKRLWVNDSKATNIDASFHAIKRYKNKKIHLILGGDNKGVNLDSFISKLQDYNINIYAIGKARHDIQILANKYNINILINHNLENAINDINKVLKINEVALLSPACASLDQFSSYEERGNTFKNLIKSF